MRFLLLIVIASMLAVPRAALAEDPGYEGIHARAWLDFGGGSSWAGTREDEHASNGAYGGIGAGGAITGIWIPHAGDLPLVSEGEIRLDGKIGLGGRARSAARGGVTATSAPRGLGIGLGTLFTGDARAGFDYVDNDNPKDENGNPIKEEEDKEGYSATSHAASIMAGAGPALTYLSRSTVLILQPWFGYGVSGMRHDWMGGPNRDSLHPIDSENHTSGVQVGGRLKYTVARGTDLNLFYGQGGPRTDIQASVAIRTDKVGRFTFEASGGAQFLDGKTYAPEETERKGNRQGTAWGSIGFGGSF